MFDAARAALAVLFPGELFGKSHAGLINAFHAHLIKTGKLPVECAKSIKWAEQLRYVADYRGDTVHLNEIRDMIVQAEFFIDRVRSAFFAI